MVTFSNAVLSHRRSRTTKGMKSEGLLCTELMGKGKADFLIFVAKLQKSI